MHVTILTWNNLQVACRSDQKFLISHFKDALIYLFLIKFVYDYFWQSEILSMRVPETTIIVWNPILSHFSEMLKYCII